MARSVVDHLRSEVDQSSERTEHREPSEEVLSEGNAERSFGRELTVLLQMSQRKGGKA